MSNDEGKQGRHRRNCTCGKHQQANQPLVNGVTPMYDTNVLTALANNPEALKIYMDSVGTPAPMPVTQAPVAPTAPAPEPVPVAIPAEFALNEIAIPMVLDPSAKAGKGYQKMVDGRPNLLQQFNSDVEAVRLGGRTYIAPNWADASKYRVEVVVRRVAL